MLRTCLFFVALIPVMATHTLAQDAPKAEPPAKRLPIKVMQAWENAEKKVQKNRDIYDAANAKALEGFQKEIEKIKPPVDVEEVVKQFQQEAIMALDANSKPPAPLPPNNNIVSFGGHRYKFVMENLSWDDAKKRCEDMGGHLLVIEGRDENTFIMNALKVFKEQNKQIGDSDCVWLGVLRNEPKGKWVTLQGTPQIFSAWRLRTGWPRDEHTRGRINIDVLEWTSSTGSVEKAPHYFICEWDN